MLSLKTGYPKERVIICICVIYNAVEKMNFSREEWGSIFKKYFAIGQSGKLEQKYHCRNSEQWNECKQVCPKHKVANRTELQSKPAWLGRGDWRELVCQEAALATSCWASLELQGESSPGACCPSGTPPAGAGILPCISDGEPGLSTRGHREHTTS